MNDSYDFLVVGAGPAGMAAAATAARLGVSTLLVDEQPAPGGQVYRGVERSDRSASTVVADDRHLGEALAAEFRASGAAYAPGIQVWQLERDGRIFVTDGAKARSIRAARVLIATGAMERPMPIRGWTLPGVMTVGAAQILYKTSAWLPPRDTWIAGSGALIWLYAAQILEAGARIQGILDTTQSRNYLRALRFSTGALRSRALLARGLELKRRVRAAGIPVVIDVSEVEAAGDGELARVRYRARGTWHELPASMLLLHQGVVPHVHATLSLGLAHRWIPLQHCFAPIVDAWGRTSIEGYAAAGDCTGIVGAEAAALQGRLAALEASRALGILTESARDREALSLRRQLEQRLPGRPFIDRLFAPREIFLSPADDVLVCRCESVTARQIRAAVRLGCLGPNQMKAFTRCGMGPCQGRMCALTATEVIARARSVDAEAVGLFNVRPPLKPLSLAELASLDAEPGSDPA